MQRRKYRNASERPVLLPAAKQPSTDGTYSAQHEAGVPEMWLS